MHKWTDRPIKEEIGYVLYVHFWCLLHMCNFSFCNFWPPILNRNTSLFAMYFTCTFLDKRKKCTCAVFNKEFFLGNFKNPKAMYFTCNCFSTLDISRKIDFFDLPLFPIFSANVFAHVQLFFGRKFFNHGTPRYAITKKNSLLGIWLLKVVPDFSYPHPLCTCALNLQIIQFLKMYFPCIFK